MGSFLYIKRGCIKTKKKIEHIRKRSIGILIILLFLISILTPVIDLSGLKARNINANPKTSTNCLFNGKMYTFNLDDFYDDENLYKTYTGAKFQTEAFNDTTYEWTGVVNNDTVTPVDNDEIQYGESSGVYNGTYDFRDGEDGTTGMDIEFVDYYYINGGTDTYAAITGEFNNHKKILEIYDYSNTGYVEVRNIFDNQLNPTIEFWIAIDKITGYRNMYLYLAESGVGSPVFLMFSDNHLRYYNGDTDVTIVDITVNTWNHVKLELNDTVNIFDCYVNNILELDDIPYYQNTTNGIDWFRILTRASNTDYSIYLDAIGIKTGDYLATESFDYITEEGVYYGTYDFRDELGETDLEIDFVDAITAGSGEIVASYADHKNVFNWSYDIAAYMYDYWSSPHITGTLEFYTFTVSGAVNHRLRAPDNEFVVRIVVYNTYIRVYYGDGLGGSIYATHTITTDFPHIKIEFDCTTDTQSVWIEGVLIVDNEPFDFDYTIDSINRFNRYAGSAFESYFNAIGYSWDTTSHSGLGYEGGWNINPYDIEPLLEAGYDLSFDWDTSVQIVDKFEGHSNVLKTYDDLSDGSPSAKVYYSSVSDPIIEFWAYTNHTSYSQMGINGMASFCFYDNKFKYYNAGWITLVDPVPINNWYHFKFVGDSDGDLVDIYINEVLEIDDLSISVGSSSNILFSHSSGSTQIALYIDALGIVGVNGYEEGNNLEGYDPDYTIGENLYPDNINMLNGSYDYSDNMKVNDASYTSFTSTHTDGYIYETPSQWDNFTFTEGSGGATGELETNNDANYATIDSSSYIAPTWRYITTCTMEYGTQSGTIADAKVDDSNYFTLTSQYIMANTYYMTTNYLGFNIAPDGSAQYISYYLWSSSPDVIIYINGDVWKTGNPHLNADDQYHAGVSSVYFYATSTSDFTIRVYYFRMNEDDAVDTELDIGATWIIPDSIQSLHYDYHTTVSVDCDLDIYNWDTTNWLELQSNTGTGWITGSYGLTDPYINVSNGVKIRFQTAEYAGDFDLELDQLSVSYTEDPAELEMTITFSFANYNEDLLAMTIQSWQKTNISQTITFKIWNYDTESYVQISSSSDTTFTKKEYNTESPSNFISPTGTVKLYWIGSDIINDFELHIDYLFIQIFYKLDLVHSRSFDTNGIYRYRWCVLGSIHYTQWVNFEVIDPVPNFHAISESDVTTRWILQNATLTPTENFTDDISGSNWNLYGVSEETFVKSPTESINYLLDNYTIASPTWRYITTCTMEYGTQSGTIADAKVDDANYFTLTSAWNPMAAMWLAYTNNLGFNIAPDGSAQNISYYLWSSSPDVRIYINDISWKTGNPHLNADNQSHSGVSSVIFSAECESSFTIRVYYFRGDSTNFAISKKYQGSGYMYMQTNITEAIALQSTTYGTNYTLSSGDYFTIDFQTSSDSQINVILLKDGIVNKTLILSQSMNTNFNRHTAQISVDEDVEFDQLKISSTFEDKDYIKIYDIKTYKYTLTGDYEDFYVGSKRTEDIYMTPDIYNLRIFEEGTKKIDTNITISDSDYYYVYTSTPNLQCRLTLFSTEGDFLNFEDYHVKVNRSLNGEYNQFWLLDNLFYVDVDTHVYIKVYDRLNSLIGSFERLASDYIDLEIEVYSLQIKNLQTQKTTIDINTTHVYPLLSGDSIYFMLAKDSYQIGYYDTNDVYKQFLIYLNSNQAYELNRSKICFLAFVNQKGEHLYFNDYKTYINDSLIYENVFYREIGDDIGIEVKDIYGISIKNQTYTVVSGDNYIPVVLTMYSLKVMSQQLCFNHINITRDPNYYESEYYWSEWIAPSEIIEFKLFAGYYKINLTNNEAGSSTYYSYTLSGDDILLIGSNNTIYNVLVNIANVNATIGNQITNVQIDLSNQNSQINNSIINVEINLGNINSTLGNMLVNLDVDITNIANNISTLYVFTENSFINLGNDINVSFISIENNVISINQSISNLVIGVSNDIYLINGTISTMITQLETNLLLMNVSIDTALFDLDTTLNLIGSNITNNFILLNNSIYLNNLNINDSRIAIINNLLLINNTITTLISEVYSAVYLINNSIYTAVVDLGTYLSLMNNTISGNLSIVLQMNDFLTEIYKMTMFSDLLNWTNIGLNTSLITTQIDVWTFINHYVNQSVEVHLRYQDLIEKLAISADDFRDQWLPNKDVEYNLWSVVDGKYVDEWKELDPDNKTVNFGFFEEDVPYDPTPIATTYFTLFIALIFFVIIVLGVLKLYYSLKERRTPIPPEVLRYMNKKSKKKIDGVVDNRI